MKELNKVWEILNPTMKWKIHDKWARRMEKFREILNFVNHLADFPEESKEFMNFCEREGGEIVLELVSKDSRF